MATTVEDSVAECFKSGKFTDLTIRCADGREFAVHKIIVCPQSEYFTKAVDEGRFKEGQTGVIELPAEDAYDAVKAMVDYLYTGDYSMPGDDNLETVEMPTGESQSKTTTKKRGPRKSGYVEWDDDGWSVAQTVQTVRASKLRSPLAEGEQHPLLLHLAVYEVADRMQLLPLKSKSEDKFELIVAGNWHHPQFIDSIKRVYDVAPPGPSGERIRRIVIKAAAEHTKPMFIDSAFDKMLREVVDFSADLNGALCGQTSLNYRPSSSPQGSERLECCGCGAVFHIRVPEEQQHLSCPVCTASRSVDEWRSNLGPVY